jgi:pyrroline-5-carboxylate reductase
MACLDASTLKADASVAIFRPFGFLAQEEEGADMLQDKTIAIVGLGKIGGTLASGLIRNRVVPKENVRGSTAHEETAREARERYGIDVTTDNAALVQGKDVIILAVKPQNMPHVLKEIQGRVTPEQLVITLAAAITTHFVEDNLNGAISVVRAMPNTPCLVSQGMTVLCPGRYATPEHIEMAKQIFSAVGQVAVIDNEELMDAVTGLSGSGPAYCYIVIEALAEGGVKVGLPRELATLLAAQTMLGAAQMVLETGEHPAKLKDAVTTPAGTTVDGLLELEAGGVRVSLIKAVDRATQKSKELSR